MRNNKGQFIAGHSVPEGWGFEEGHSPVNKIWSEEEVELLKENYSIKTSKELDEMFGQKTIKQINIKKRELNLYKTKETKSRICGGRRSGRKGLSYQEIYGKDRAVEIKNKISVSRTGVIPNRVYDNPPRYWLGKSLPTEMKEKISKTLREGASSFFKFKDHPEWRKRNLKALMKKPTKPELRVLKIIEDYDFPFKYVGDGEKIIGGYNPDFVATDGSKKVIEVFGRAFHDPEVSFLKEIPFHATFEGRKVVMRQCGYDCLILWDDELGDEDRVIKQIREFV